MKFEELSQEEVDIIKKYCEIHEDDFRLFLRDKMTDDPFHILNGEELAYEFSKPRIRDGKIDSLLEDEEE